MSDNTKLKGHHDATLISLSERWEVAYWREALGVSEDALRKAVNRVGHSAKAVRDFLKKRPAPSM
ncbi:MAG TPA: DUF3606 domain-containing protein [Planctomycetaceae bacterium]|nr:DUF3606 domain-containing protein [Planctomycetaceae bacterium]